MSLDGHDPPSPDDLIRHGEELALSKLSEMATAEAKAGDGRAIRQLQRLMEACGYRRGVKVDDGN